MKTCSFFGHRDTKETPELVKNIKSTVVQLIKEKEVQSFLFGSASRFDEICLKIVTELKKEFPEIKLIYVRSHYPNIGDGYRDYLLKIYDETIMPKGIERAGKASYVERNQAMIDASDFCVFYYDEGYHPPLRKRSKNTLSNYHPKSGTRIAYEYAKLNKKTIYNLVKTDL